MHSTSMYTTKEDLSSKFELRKRIYQHVYEQGLLDASEEAVDFIQKAREVRLYVRMCFVWVTYVHVLIHVQ